jgi:hypothetical protein
LPVPPAREVAGAGCLYWPADGRTILARSAGPTAVSEFNWWLLIVGLVVGAGLVWLVLADSARRDADLEADELPAEAAWIAEAMTDLGRPIDQSDAAEVLRLHRAYLAAPPPDDEPPVEADSPGHEAADVSHSGAQRGEPAA